MIENEPTNANTLPVRRHQLASIPGFYYLSRLPTRPDPAKILVVVHGISRQSRLMLTWFAEAAEQHGFTLLAPHFSKLNFPNYQRLGKNGRDRADLAFLAMLQDFDRLLPGTLETPVCLFGFSGGSQFAHRFSITRSNHVQKLIAVSAGWYTALDFNRRYPYGLGGTPWLQCGDVRMESFLAIPTLTLIGELDRKLERSLRQRPELNCVQGTNRFLRAHWWHQHLQSLADPLGLSDQHLLNIIPETGHDFRTAVLKGNLVERVFCFLTGAPSA